MPFTHDAFLDVFGAYNAQLWPAALLLWIASAALVWRWLRPGGASGRVSFGILAVHWGWSGIAYHGLFFRRINPAATLFAGVFVLQAALFAWLAIRSKERVRRASGWRGLLGGGLAAYGLLYPAVGLAFGLEIPRLPLFAVPCPTTLVTAGLLLSAVDAPRISSVVPTLWAAVGSSAAFVLGMHADLALIVAGAAMAVGMLAPRASRPSR